MNLGTRLCVYTYRLKLAVKTLLRVLTCDYEGLVDTVIEEVVNASAQTHNYRQALRNYITGLFTYIYTSFSQLDNEAEELISKLAEKITGGINT